jgi:hypothetical protein
VIGATSIRRSVGLTAFPVLVALVVAHVLGRDRTWVHEWVWGLYQYGFVTVLLGPLVAGVAAWEGARLARARTLVRTADRAVGAVAVAWLGVASWTFAAYAAGLALVAALVVGAGTPGLPPPIAVAATVPPALLLVAEAAGGLAVGWWARQVLVAPAVTIGVFLLTLWLYVSGPGALVVVGGATGSLADLEPRASLVVWQCVWFTSATALGIVAAAALPGWLRHPRRWLLPAAVTATVALAVPLVGQGEVYLVSLPAGARQEVCTGTAPTVCVLPGYARHAVEARRALLPYLDAFRRLGVPVPSTFRQDATPGEQTVGPVASDLLLGNRSLAKFAVLAAYLPKSCANQVDLLDTYSWLAAWLSSTVDHERTSDPTVPALVLGPDSPAQRAWVLDAVRSLRDCDG